MARFYTTVDNSKGNTTSAAGRSAGQTAHIRGWHAGVQVDAVPDGDKDTFRVYRTGGSAGCERELLGVLDAQGVWTAAELVCADCMRAGLTSGPDGGPHCLFCDGPLDDHPNNDEGPCIRTDLVGAGEVVDNG